MKSGRIIGGAAIPAVIDTGRRKRSSMAQPVFNATGLNRGIQGGAAENIIQITSEDLVQNGGNYSLIGGPPIPMQIVTGRRSKQGAATVVYPVDVLGNYDPSFAGYIHKVLTANPAAGYDPSSLIQFLPQNELAGGVSIDYSGLGHDGAYTAVNLGQPGVPGMGMSSAGYDGATSYNNIWSAALQATFNGAEGTLLQYVQIAAGAWTDGALRYIGTYFVDANNRIRILKLNTNNNLFFAYEAAGTDLNRTIGGNTTTDYFTVGITWSATDDEVLLYIAGIQQGAAINGLGIWAGNLSNTNTVIGSVNTVPGNVWNGNIGPTLVYTVAQPPASMLYLSTP